MDRTLMLRFPQNCHCVKAPRHLFVGGRKCPLYNIILARDDVPHRFVQELSVDLVGIF